jgi:uncharacterized protein YndB with AHSA1/START domain
MTLKKDTIIASEPKHVFKALLNPEDLSAWWGCDAVIDARPGGTWVGGWGVREDELGHQTVLSAEVSRFETDRVVALKMGETEIVFEIAPDPAGTRVTVSQSGYPSASPDEEQGAFQSWVDAVGSLKAWAEKHHRYEPQPQAVPGSQPAAGDGVDPYGGLDAMAKGDIRVLDDGGFGVTDPNGVIKSWSKEQGFGYVTHPELGDIVFDYDGCDFEPDPGDKVLILVLKKSWDGKPKVKRIACPAKGSSIKA